MRRPLAAVPAAAQEAILAWYGTNGRALPFRATRDPWAILVSEVIAQQTQATRAGERWRVFMSRFPSVADVADATPADLLRAWQGLGYNRRALAIRRAARAILDEHGGLVPADVEALQRLPGVGPYTARAVAAIAFGRRVGAVDTNVRRVLTRLTGAIGLPAATLQAVADRAVPADRAGDWTHALMDLGASCCRPRTPRCSECPAMTWCRWSSAPWVPPTASTRRPKRAFSSTSRYLRGRILDLLREADGWVTLPGKIASFEAEAIEASLAVLASEGLAEGHSTDRRKARLPVA